MRLKAANLSARHHGAQKDGLESTTVISEMAMRLAEGRDNLRYLKTEHSVRVSERGPMTPLVALVSFSRVRPDLDALIRMLCLP